MDKEYFLHNIYMAEIAECIINDKVPLSEESLVLFSKEARYQDGVREIIGLYLLIPYINDEGGMLKYDKKHSQISIFDEKEVVFSDINGNPIYYKDLRDTICHSFVSCDKGAYSEPVLVFDDRIILSRNEHEKLSNTDNGTQCVLVKNTDVMTFLKKAYSRINVLFKNNMNEATSWLACRFICFLLY